MKWYVEIRHWQQPPGPWLRIGYYKSKPWAVRRVQHLIHLAIRFNTRESIRLVEVHK